MHHPAEREVSGVDAARVAAVAEALGARRLAELLSLLQTRLGQIEAAIESLPDGTATLMAALHQSRGSATSLGLTTLAGALADIEAQIADPAMLASVKHAGGALSGRWQAAANAVRRLVPDIDPDHAPGICIR